MEREQIPEAWIDEIVTLRLGDGGSVSGTLRALNDRGVVVYVGSNHHSHEPSRHLFYPWASVTAIQYVEER